MSGMSWFPFYPNDWLGSVRVRRMTNEQRGAYLMLMIWQWQSPGGVLENDSKVLSTCAEVNDITDAKWNTVLECFPEVDGKRANAKLHGLWIEANNRKAKAIESAGKRWAGHAKADAKALPRHCDGICSPPPPPPPPPEPYQEKNIVEQEFDLVWKLYPDKSGRQNAFKAWMKWRQAGDNVDQVKAGIQRYIDYVSFRRKSFPELKYKNGSTFFNGREWMSEWTVESAKKSEPAYWTDLGGTTKP